MIIKKRAELTSELGKAHWYHQMTVGFRDMQFYSPQRPNMVTHVDVDTGDWVIMEHEKEIARGTGETSLYAAITAPHRSIDDCMSNIVIKHRWTSAVLFEGESGMNMSQTLEKATAAKANLSSANLSGSDLSGANLSGANLSGADLRRAYLSGADLSDANLSGSGLSGANLSGANLSGADLSGNKLVEKRAFFTIGPIGSRSDYIQAWITDGGLMIRAGCFFDTREKFAAKLEIEHGDNEHGQEYRAALVLIDKHAELWTNHA